MISTQAYVVGGTYSMTSMTASALRPWRSKCSRWRSPLPLLVGPGTAETQLGSHSGMRLASEMRSNTSWMVTPTVPVYVSETGRMGDNMAAERQRAPCRPCRPAYRRAAVRFGGVAGAGVPILSSRSARGCSSAGRAPGSHPGGQGFEPPQLHGKTRRTGVREPCRLALSVHHLCVCCVCYCSLTSSRTVPLGVTGNTPDSGSGESWFEPRRGNSKRDARIKRVALRVFLGPTSVSQAFTPLPLLESSRIYLLLTFLSRSFTGVLITSSIPSVVANW